MFRVSKCCFCFHLKYGFFTFGVISLICRVIAITMLWGMLVATSSYIPTIARSSDDTKVAYQVSFVYALSVAPWLGYSLATTVALLIALRGIMMDKSILIFPYIVVLVLEMIANTIFHFYLVAIATAIFLISLIITTALDFYILVCLWSLYKEITQREEMCKPTAPISFTNEQAVI